jgi:hypothetical protein
VVPPGPAHASEYAVVAVNGPVLWLPLVASAPLQPPEAEHEAAFAEFQVNVELPPTATATGAATRVTVGTGITVTVAVTSELVPPGPVQVSAYVAFWVSKPVPCVPLAASAPFQSPAAAQAVAWAELQVSVDPLPTGTVVGVAVNCAVGSGFTAMLTLAV